MYAVFIISFVMTNSREHGNLNLFDLLENMGTLK
jgi:hypothetical protein